MIRFHKEGFGIILGTIAVVLLLNVGIYFLFPNVIAQSLVFVFTMTILVLVLQFFRNPDRSLSTLDNSLVYSPCDGKVVVIEETTETEYFKDRRIQVSIFMSPLNVHVNRNPVSGKVAFAKYHEGLYLVAWHPKSSTDNERTTVVYDTGSKQILMRQIAGFVARRIIYYLKPGDTVKQGDDMGFIRFGSRVDLFLPLGTDIQVKIGDVVKGNRNVIAKL